MLKNPSQSCVFIRDMRVSVRIGLLDSEKLAPQKLDVSIECYVDRDYLRAAAAGGTFIDYAVLHDFILGWEQAPHIEMIETLAMQAFECAFSFNDVLGARVCIAKPDIFKATDKAGLDMYYTRADFYKS